MQITGYLSIREAYSTSNNPSPDHGLYQVFLSSTYDRAFGKFRVTSECRILFQLKEPFMKKYFVSSFSFHDSNVITKQQFTFAEKWHTFFQEVQLSESILDKHQCYLLSDFVQTIQISFVNKKKVSQLFQGLHKPFPIGPHIIHSVHRSSRMFLIAAFIVEIFKPRVCM